MKIIIGLGNIGREYENTRHNAGFMAIDKLAKMLEMDFNQEKFSAYFQKKKIDGEDVILLKPTTYMNNSGIALRQCMDFLKCLVKISLCCTMIWICQLESFAYAKRKCWRA